MVIIKKRYNLRHIKLENKEKINEMFYYTVTYKYSDRLKEIITYLLNNLNINNLYLLYKKPDNLFNNITLIPYPYIEYFFTNEIFGKSNRELRNMLRDEFNNIVGYNKDILSNSVYPPLNNNFKRLIYKNLPIGDYYPDKNIIFIYFNIFSSTSQSIYKKFYDILKKTIENNNIVINKQKINYEKEIINDFINIYIKNNIKKISNDLNRDINKLKNLQKDIIKLNTNIINNIKIKETLEINKINFKTKLISELNKLKNIEFVKNVNFTDKGIEINVGDVNIDYRNKNYYLGNFNIYLTPSQFIKIYNKHHINEYHHPHILRETPCFGDFFELVNNSYMNFDLVRLINILYKFLHTYNPTSEYIKIDAFHNAIKNKYNPKITN